MIHLSSQFGPKNQKLLFGNICNAIVAQTTVMIQYDQRWSLSVVDTHIFRKKIILIYVNFRGQCIRHNH